jgi:hypothetical protein
MGIRDNESFYAPTWNFEPVSYYLRLSKHAACVASLRESSLPVTQKKACVLQDSCSTVVAP